MTYKIKIDETLPLFTEHTPVKELKRRYTRPDGTTVWSFGGQISNRAPLHVKRARPKMMKKLLRTVKRTKAKIVAVRSEFQSGIWTKIITVVEVAQWKQLRY